MMYDFTLDDATYSYRLLIRIENGYENILTISTKSIDWIIINSYNDKTLFLNLSLYPLQQWQVRSI